jgi:hypothetical protein
VLDESTLRERFPEIPWDQPMMVTFSGRRGTEPAQTSFLIFTCRYCAALAWHSANFTVGFWDREQALDHIEREHHD